VQCGRAIPQVSKFRESSKGPKARLTREGQNLKTKRVYKCRNRIIKGGKERERATDKYA